MNAQVCRRRILLVDDESALRSAMSDALAAEGHIVYEAGSVADAESVFSDERCDVVITDLRLPDGCGLDLLARLRALDTRFAAIVTTGYGTYEQALEAIRLRVAAFLSKPFSAAELIRIIAEQHAPAQSEPGSGSRFAAPATEAAVESLTQQIEAELARSQAQPWVAARALELLCDALENVVAHAYPEGPGAVEVSVARDGEALVLNVNDRGCGFDVASALSSALEGHAFAEASQNDPGILKFHRDADEVRIHSQPGRGTNIKLRFRHAFAASDAVLAAPSDDETAVACLWS